MATMTTRGALRATTAVGWMLVLLVGGLLLGAGPSGAARGVGATLAVVGATLAAGWSVRWFGRAPAPSLAQLEGRAATLLPRRAGPFRIGVAILAELALALGVGALAAATGGSAGGAVALGLVAASFAWPVVLAASGRYVAGGVWLTPDGVLSRYRGVELRAAWSDIDLAVGDDARGYVALRPRPGVRLAHTSRAGPFRGVRTPATDDVVLLPTAELAVDAATLARIVQLAVNEPARRASFAEPVGLQLVADVAATPR